jgi:CheY-like chemotaxis protein
MNYLGGRGEFVDRTKFPFPCLLLLDLNLPIKTGFDVLEYIQENPSLTSLKVVVVSASGQQLDIDLARKFGIIDYIIKPSTPARLVDIVKKHKDNWLS